MFLIVGLGNPGKEYAGTRHNIGFEAIDYIADKHNIDMNKVKFKGIFGEGIVNTKKVILLKPTTYMNLSGESIAEVVNFYKIPKENIIVIYDDISLEVGRIRIREKGSHGGHNGIRSIISCLSTDVFPRIKIGVGGPKGDLASHVLGRFGKDEIEILRECIIVSNDASITIMNKSTKEAMNKFNGFNSSKTSTEK